MESELDADIELALSLGLDGERIASKYLAVSPDDPYGHKGNHEAVFAAGLTNVINFLLSQHPKATLADLRRGLHAYSGRMVDQLLQGDPDGE